MENTGKHLLFGLTHSSEGTPSNTWNIKTINLRTLHYRQLQTCYEFVVPIAVTIPPEATCFSSNVNIHMVCNMLQSFTGSLSFVTRILTTNLMVNVITTGLIETLSNDLGFMGRSELKKRASILIVYCKNYITMKRVYDHVKSLRTPYVYVLPYEDHLYFGLEVFVKNNGHVAPDFEKSSMLVRHAHFKEPKVNIKSVYTPYGVYVLRQPQCSLNTIYGGLEIVLTDKQPPPLHHVLPVISFDIETIASSTNIVPIGVTSDEKISSLVMYCVYGKAQYCLVLFLLPAHVRKSVGEEFCRRMSLKYSDRSKRRVFHFLSVPSERTLLWNFTKMYLKGVMLSLFNLPPNYPHVLVGHNICQYDIPFIIERYKFHDMQSHLLDSGAIIMPNSEQTTFIFLENTILFDTLFLARANCLSGTFSLSALAKVRLPDNKVGKMELNSVTIRNLYNIAQTSKNGLNQVDIDRLFQVDETENMSKYVSDDTNAQLNLSTYPIKFCSINNCTLAIPYMETILAYNIQDTITVYNIMVDSNIFTIINQLTNLFGVQLDAATMRGNSYRIGACMVIEALADGQFLFSLLEKRPPDTCIVPQSIPVLLNCGQINKQYASIRLQSLMNGTEISADLTKVGFKGALNYASAGVHWHGKSLDFTSYYPNLMRFLNCDYGSCDILKQSDLLFLNRFDSLMKLSKRGFLDFYRMDDPGDVQIADLLDPRYRGREIGQCLSWDDLVEISEPNTPILCILRDADHTNKDSFLTKLITKMLIRRDERKAQFKKEHDPVVRGRLDSEQLSLKILLNSKYGLKGNPNFHNKHIPLSAAVTLFGRKFLTICSRLIVCFQILVRSANYTPEQIAEVNIHLEYLKRNALNWRSCYQTERETKHETDEFMFEPEKFVVYVDTDGIKYKDPYHIDTEHICQQINNTLAECLGVPYLTLSVEPEVDRLVVLTCKSYATFSYPNKVTHTGYERNVNSCIKHIFNSIVQVTNIYMTPHDHPLYILFDVFIHLEMANQALMYERIKLNKHKTESTLQRYICSVTQDFRGDVATVMLEDAHDVQKDWYMTHAEWLNSNNPPPINTFKFIRKVFLIILRLIFFDAELFKKNHLENDSQVASQLLNYTSNIYGGTSVSMNWTNVKKLGLLAYIICRNLTTGEFNEVIIKKHLILFNYCTKIYEKYKRVARIKIDKIDDITKDGLRPKCTSSKRFQHVYYDIFSKYE